MAIFLTKDFGRFARKARLQPADLRRAAEEVAVGRSDASLGQSVYKQRLARQGGGKSGGFRTIIVFRAGSHSFFVHAYAKNEKANVSARDLMGLKRLAVLLLSYTADELQTATDKGELIEVMEDGGEQED